MFCVGFAKLLLLLEKVLFRVCFACVVCIRFAKNLLIDTRVLLRFVVFVRFCIRFTRVLLRSLLCLHGLYKMHLGFADLYKDVV